MHLLMVPSSVSNPMFYGKSPKDRKLTFLPFANEITTTSNTPWKLIWMFILTCCCVGFLYSFSILVLEYLNSSGVSKVELIDVDQLKLPAVEICTPNPLSISKLMADNFSLPEISYLHTFFTTVMYSKFDLKKTTATVLEDTPNPYKFDNIEAWDKFLLKYGPSCESLLARCTVAEQNRNCCEYAKTVFHVHYGVCFAFEGDQQTTPGAHAGLTIVASSIDESRPAYARLPMHKGIFLNIYPLFTQHRPRDVYQGDEILIPANKETHVSLQTVRYKRGYGKPCKVNEESSSLCKSRIYGQLAVEFCNCTVLGNSPKSTEVTKVCFPWELQQCLQKYAQDMHRAFSAYGESECKWRPCHQVSFSSSVHYMDILTDQVALALEQPIEEAPKRDYFKIHVYFHDFLYVSVEDQKIVTFTRVLSGVGGLLSLYLGLNLVNVSKVVIFVFKTCCDCIVRKTNRKSAKPMAESAVRKSNKRQTNNASTLVKLSNTLPTVITENTNDNLL